MFKLFQNVLSLLGKLSITPVTLFALTVVFGVAIVEAIIDGVHLSIFKQLQVKLWYHSSLMVITQNLIHKW